MPESKLGSSNVGYFWGVNNELYRETRNSWMDVGLDNFTKPPAQNPDLFMVFTNILPPATKVLMRRYGYRTFSPKLDSGSGDQR